MRLLLLILALATGPGLVAKATGHRYERAIRESSVQIREVAPLPAPFSAPRVTWPGPGQVAVTFDDGPCRAATTRVVDLMGDRVATFFVVGVNVQRDPAPMRYAAERGHSIQNHSMWHREQIHRSDAEIRDSLAMTSNLIVEVVGSHPTSFRPPYGSTNARVLGVVEGEGYHQALWNGGPWSMDADAAGIRTAVIGQVRGAAVRGEGLTILFHDCSGRPPQLLAALPDVLAAIDAAGFEYVALS